jgi:hypothetical protein
MQLTLEEVTVVERLRKRERQWPRIRWIVLVVGVFSLACYGYITISMFRRMDFQHLELYDVFFFALFWPKCLLMFILGMGFIVWALNDWRGNANRRLLRKLLDAQMEGSGRTE